MLKDAIISEDGKYRYALSRGWCNKDSTSPIKFLGFLMLNPSTADANQDDPTIRKCIGFAKKFGFDGMVAINLFAFRATDPKELKDISEEFVGPQNLGYISNMFYGDYRGPVTEYVMAWGSNKLANEWLKKYSRYLPRRKYCLGINKNGSPKHPLYVPYNKELILWNS